jgi:hypothetical protein
MGTDQRAQSVTAEEGYRGNKFWEELIDYFLLIDTDCVEN